jgi:DNA invertase Pin-like site-specific DNA recombinase
VPLCLGCHSKVHGRQMIHTDLIRAGMARAKAEGKRWGGRKAGTRINVTVEKEERVNEMYAAKIGISEIARVTGLSRQTVYKVLGKWERKKVAE